MDPRQLELNGEPLLPSTLSQANDSEVLDRNWVKIAFMVSDDDIGDETDIINRYYTSASAKYTDTRLGCNIGINPKPQWTRYADIRVRGRMSDRKEVSLTHVTGNYGMGAAYSENIDDPAQRIYMRFGVPKFNSLFNFLTRAFSREQTILARTGRAPTAWYQLGNVVGTAIAVIAFPALAIGVFSAKALAYLFQRPTSKFFTLKPTMYMYWNTVNILVMNHAVNTGLIKKVFAGEEAQRLGRPYTIDEAQLKSLTNLFPDVFRNGTFDIVAMATKAQRLANNQFMELFNRLDNAEATDFEGYLRRDVTGDGSHSSTFSDKTGTPTLGTLMNKLLMFGSYYTAEKDEQVIQELDPRLNADKKPPPGNKVEGNESHIQSMINYMDAEFRDGADWAVFRVDYTGSAQESFANSLGESAMSQKLNGVSSQFREARFSMADGNIFGGIINDIQNAVTDVVIGGADGVTLGFAGLVAGLGGSGYIDIPKHWQSSNANLPRGSYKIRLISPYNNPVSRMMSIWIPFYMLLAGALPRSIGHQSYTSPYYCQIYDRGRLQSKLAMIESVSISRGVSNLGFDINGQALAVDVQFNVVDLSSIMHMPISSGGLTETDMAMDDDNITMDYLNVLAGMDLYSQIYSFPKAQLKLTAKLANLKYRATSPAFHTAFFKNAITDGFINDITLGASGLAYDLVTAPMKGSTNTDGTRF